MSPTSSRTRSRCARERSSRERERAREIETKSSRALGADRGHHRAQIAASLYTPVNDDSIPTGEIHSTRGAARPRRGNRAKFEEQNSACWSCVEENRERLVPAGAMDLSTRKQIGADLAAADQGVGYDHNWVLRGARCSWIVCAKARDGATHTLRARPAQSARTNTSLVPLLATRQRECRCPLRRREAIGADGMRPVARVWEPTSAPPASFSVCRARAPCPSRARGSVSSSRADEERRWGLRAGL